MIHAYYNTFQTKHFCNIAKRLASCVLCLRRLKTCPKRRVAFIGSSQSPSLSAFSAHAATPTTPYIPLSGRKPAPLRPQSPHLIIRSQFQFLRHHLSAPSHAADLRLRAARKTVHEMWEMLLPLLVATLLFFGILAAVHAAALVRSAPRWLRGCLEPPPTRGGRRAAASQAARARVVRPLRRRVRRRPRHGHLRVRRPPLLLPVRLSTGADYDRNLCECRLRPRGRALPAAVVYHPAQPAARAPARDRPPARVQPPAALVPSCAAARPRRRRRHLAATHAASRPSAAPARTRRVEE